MCLFSCYDVVVVGSRGFCTWRISELSIVRFRRCFLDRVSPMGVLGCNCSLELWVVDTDGPRPRFVQRTSDKVACSVLPPHACAACMCRLPGLIRSLRLVCLTVWHGERPGRHTTSTRPAAAIICAERAYGKGTASHTVSVRRVERPPM